MMPTVLQAEQRVGLRHDRAPDVSVVIATHGGRQRIVRTLDSLERQTLGPDRFEIVVIINGPYDGTADMLHIRARTSSIPIRVVHTPVAGFANARNLGIHAARGTYVTWIDDDDWVSPEFLETLLSSADPGSVVTPIFGDVDVDRPGSVNFDNYINQKTLRNLGRKVGFAELPTAASFDAGKLVATSIARTGAFDDAMSSGVDVLYWSQLILRNRLSIRVVDPASHAVYYREIRTGSVSRRIDDRFMEDRLHCVRGLEALRREFPASAGTLLGSQRSQAGHLGAWLELVPTRRIEVLAKVRDLGIPDFPYEEMNHRSAKRLVVSVAFPPAQDTSGMVVARRLLLEGEAFDVVTQNMDTIREVDRHTLTLVREHLGGSISVGGQPTFANWPSITRFSEAGLEGLSGWEAAKGPYPHLYSRAMWPAAHVLAAAYKERRPETKWTAEFSDPLLIDVRGERRVSDLPPNRLLTAINAQAARSGFNVATDNFFAWVESITYALADRIWFTNELQRTFMLERAASPDLAARAMGVSEIRPHPGVPLEYYSKVVSDYRLDPERINIGYFGVFYATRGIGDLLSTMAGLPRPTRRRVTLHIFTSKPDDERAAVASQRVEDCVRVNPYLPYLEFLNLTTRLDWLLVADARVKGTHGINPYVPSKYAEYRDSGSKIWSLVEPGSTLSTLPADAMTEIGDAQAAADFLRTF